MINPKQLRILFVDDEQLAIVNTLKGEGYDVDYWADVDTLENLVDGRYHIVFLDVRGIGSKYGGNGLDVLKYVGSHNPLVYPIVFSAKPFNGAESELVRRYARLSIPKDCTFYEVVEAIEAYSKTIDISYVLSQVEKTSKLGWWQKFKLRRGNSLSPKEIEKLAKSSGIGADALKIIANTTGIALSLIKMISGGAG